MQSAEKTHILVVDDEEGVRELFKLNLVDVGYACHAASSGEAALEVLDTKPVEMALVDIMMPRMTGLSLFQHIRERYPDVAVVFITAVDDLNLAVKNLKDGAYDYLVKPVTRARLQQVVEETLDRRRAVLEERQHHGLLEEQTVIQTEELEAKARELGALNRMIQSELTQRFTEDEGRRSDE